jgi:hypothetical protein
MAFLKLISAFTNQACFQEAPRTEKIFDLKAYWRLGEASGTDAVDSSGNENTSTKQHKIDLPSL